MAGERATVYAAWMAKVTPCDVPEGSLLAAFGGPEDYRDCFYRDVPGEVTLAEYIERFYCSAAFRPERVVLGLIGHGASNEDAKALANGETDGIALWRVVERREYRSATSGPQGRPPARSDATEGRMSEESLRGRMAPPALEAKENKRGEILLEAGRTNTASWFAVEPREGGTRLLFGSWVGGIEQSGWRVMLNAHVWYSKLLLGGV